MSKIYIKWFLIGLILLIFTQIFFGIIFNVLDIGEKGSDLNKTKALLSNPSIMFITFIIAPLIEEFIFRYLIFRKNARYPFNIITAIVSSLLFGIVHGKSLVLTIPLIFNGFIYCYIYDRTNSIWISIITHSVFNILIFILLFISIG